MREKFERLYAIKEAIDQVDFVDGRWIIRPGIVTSAAQSIIENILKDWSAGKDEDGNFARDESGNFVLAAGVSEEEIADSVIMSEIGVIEPVEDIENAVAIVVGFAQELIDVVYPDLREHLKVKLAMASKCDDMLGRVREEMDAIIEFCRLASPYLSVFSMRAYGEGDIAIGWDVDYDEVVWHLSQKASSGDKNGEDDEEEE